MGEGGGVGEGERGGGGEGGGGDKHGKWDNMNCISLRDSDVVGRGVRKHFLRGLF